MTQITHTRKFKVGKTYKLRELYDYVSDNDDFLVDNYGGNEVGNAVTRLMCGDTYIWLILDAQTDAGQYYKCIANNQFNIL